MKIKKVEEQLGAWDPEQVPATLWIQSVPKGTTMLNPLLHSCLLKQSYHPLRYGLVSSY